MVPDAAPQMFRASGSRDKNLPFLNFYSGWWFSFLVSSFFKNRLGFRVRVVSESRANPRSKMHATRSNHSVALTFETSAPSPTGYGQRLTTPVRRCRRSSCTTASTKSTTQPSKPTVTCIHPTASALHHVLQEGLLRELPAPLSL